MPAGIKLIVQVNVFCIFTLMHLLKFEKKRKRSTFYDARNDATNFKTSAKIT